MKIRYVLIIITIIFTNNLFAHDFPSKDSLKLNFSFYYYVDLSDTYSGGDIFLGEVGVSKSWYGVELGYGHFQSQSTFILRVPVEELNGLLGIPFDEMAIMKDVALSLKIIPIKTSWINTELLFGMAYAKAEWSCYKSVDFNYSIIENRFTYLSRDYQLIRKKHVGYQFGINIGVYPFKKVGAGLNLSARIQDLNHGGTFFFVGGGICFKM